MERFLYDWHLQPSLVGTMFMQLCTNKDVEEDNYKFVNMKVSNAEFKILEKSVLQTFDKEGNVFNTFVRAQ